MRFLLLWGLFWLLTVLLRWIWQTATIFLDDSRFNGMQGDIRA